MVLWEITLGTAYFLGLKRTYRLALRMQRKIISSKRPKIRNFLQRRTRPVFDIALKVHQNIQQRDIEVGRNLGNWILRWLDRMKPSAQIRGPSPLKPTNRTGSNMDVTKHGTSCSHIKIPRNIQSFRNHDSDRHLFISSFPSIAKMMRSPRPAGTITQYRHFCMWSSKMVNPNYNIDRVRGFEGVLRKDIMQYLLQN